MYTVLLGGSANVTPFFLIPSSGVRRAGRRRVRGAVGARSPLPRGATACAVASHATPSSLRADHTVVLSYPVICFSVFLNHPQGEGKHALLFRNRKIITG